MNLICTMSLAGGAGVLTYCLIGRLFRGKFSVQGRELLLKLTMLLFLCPFQMIKHHLPKALMRRIPGFFKYSENRFYLDLSGYVTVPGKAGRTTLFRSWEVWLLVLGIAIAVVFVIRQVMQYLHLRSALLGCSREASREEIGRFLAKHPDIERRVQAGKLKIFWSAAVKEPFTMGIRRPVVFLPQSEWRPEELELIYGHEFAHIRNRDVLVKCICLLIVLVHWFNPMAYVLLVEFGKMAEYRCDEEAMRRREEKERAVYAELIVRAAAEKSESGLWITGFAGSKKGIYRRVEVIMDMGKKKGKKPVTVLAVALAVLCSVSTLYVYKAQAQVQVYGESEFIRNEGEIIFTPEEYGQNESLVWDETGELVIIEEEILDFSESKELFIADETGEIDSVQEESAIERVTCSHTYVSGRVQRHIADGKGGCKVSTYQGRQCTKCGLVELTTLLYHTTYVVCPH